MSVPRSGHLTNLEVERYCPHSLDPAELLAVDDHIHECEACRQRLAQGEPLEAAWRGRQPRLPLLPPREGARG